MLLTSSAGLYLSNKCPATHTLLLALEQTTCNFKSAYRNIVRIRHLKIVMDTLGLQTPTASLLTADGNNLSMKDVAQWMGMSESLLKNVRTGVTLIHHVHGHMVSHPEHRRDNYDDEHLKTSLAELLESEYDDGQHYGARETRKWTPLVEIVSDYKKWVKDRYNIRVLDSTPGHYI